MLILGSDKRQAELAKLYGVELIPEDDKRLKKLIKKSDIIVLPISVTNPADFVGARLGEPVGDAALGIPPSINIQNSPPVEGCLRSRRGGVLIIGRDEIINDKTFAIQNATPTAEGAILLALRQSEKTLAESQCLVLGYGNCGKEIVRLLKGFDAKVDYVDKESGGMNEDLTSYDIIFNTIPKQVLTGEEIEQISNKIILNIASHQAGFPKECQYNAIPAKHFPVTAAKIMKETIDKIIEEEGAQNV